MSALRPSPTMSAAARAALIDAYFDGEMDAPSRDAFHDALKTDPNLAKEFARTAFVVEALKRPVATPDLTASILTEVSARTGGRAWASPGARRWAQVGRYAAAASLLFTLGVALFARRQAPDQFVSAPAPLTEVVERGGAGAANAVGALTGAFDSAKQAARRIGAIAQAPTPLARAERTSAYVFTTERDAEDAGELIVRWSATPEPAGFSAADIGPSRALWRRAANGDVVVARSSPPRGW